MKHGQRTIEGSFKTLRKKKMRKKKKKKTKNKKTKNVQRWLGKLLATNITHACISSPQKKTAEKKKEMPFFESNW